MRQRFMTMFSQVPEGPVSHENSRRQGDLRIVHGVTASASSHPFRVELDDLLEEAGVDQTEEGGAPELLLPPRIGRAVGPTA